MARGRQHGTETEVPSRGRSQAADRGQEARGKKGNRIQVGLSEEDNFIAKANTKKRMPLRKSGTGSFLMDVSFKGNLAKAEICVDSAAEDCVCPVGGGPFGIRDAPQWKRFRGFNGAEIMHYAEREIIAKQMKY